MDLCFMLCFMMTRLALYTTFKFLKNEIIKYTVSCILACRLWRHSRLRFSVDWFISLSSFFFFFFFFLFFQIIAYVFCLAWTYWNICLPGSFIINFSKCVQSSTVKWLSRLIQLHFLRICPILNGGVCIKQWHVCLPGSFNFIFFKRVHSSTVETVGLFIWAY